EEGHGSLVAHAVLPGAANELIKDGETVTDRAGSCTHNKWEDALCDLDVLLTAHVGHVVFEDPGRHQPERVVVGSGSDGPNNLFGLRRCENKLNVRRGLFNKLEESVKALGRDHVGLVNN